MTGRHSITRVAALAVGLALSSPALASTGAAARAPSRTPAASVRLAKDEARIAMDRERIHQADLAGVHAWLAGDMRAFNVIVYARDQASHDLHRDLAVRQHDATRHG